jgi:hypothetical protein
MAQTRRKKLFARRVWEAALIVLLLPLVLPLLVVGLVLRVLNKIIVYLLIWLWWLPTGKDVLFVSSDSPVWQEYMETQILPLVARRAMVLNWSERSRWSKLSFTVRVFRTFGRGRDFNPMVVLFRPLRRARVFRFLPAFKDWKCGHTENLEQLRRDLMVAL